MMSFEQSILPLTMDENRKLNDVKAFTPDLKILRLTKMPELDPFRKSPSVPTSPTAFRAEQRNQFFPAYVTLGRKMESRRISSNGSLPPVAVRSFSDTGNELEEVKKIRSILASLDLAKYKRRHSDREVPSLRRTVSDQPCYHDNNSTTKTFSLYNLPRPPSMSAQHDLTLTNNVTSPLTSKFSSDSLLVTKANNNNTNKTISSKLKMLTEKLVSSSAPSSPLSKIKMTVPQTAPPISNVTFWKEPLPPIAQSSFTYDDYEDICKSRTQLSELTSDGLNLKFGISQKCATLPRSKNTSRLMNTAVSEGAGTYNSSSNTIRKLKPDYTLLNSLVNRVVNREKCKNNEVLSKINQESVKKLGILSLPPPPRFKQQHHDDNDIFSSKKHLRTLDRTDTHEMFSIQNSDLAARRLNLEKHESVQTRSNEKSEYSYVSDKNVKSENENVSSTEWDFLKNSPKPLPTQYTRFYSSGNSLKRESAPSQNKYVSDDDESYLPAKGIDFTSDDLPLVKQRETKDKNNQDLHAIPTSTTAMSPELTKPLVMNETDEQSQFQPQRYSKKRLRGPYGEMLEQEMSKPRPTYTRGSEFLKELDNIQPIKKTPRPFLRSTSHSFEVCSPPDGNVSPKRKTSANMPMVKTEKSLILPVVAGTTSEPILHASTANPWTSRISKTQDTRTHVVGELFETETSYVESLQIIVKKYMKPLKCPEYAGTIDSNQVDEIFYQIPEILNQHEAFLDVLKLRMANWDTKQKIGDVFIDVFTRQSVIDTYTAFINNWKHAKDVIKTASAAKTAFAKFLEQTSREHKGKLTLDALLIMPVQRIPRYELLIKELLKHTPVDHPDHRLLLQAQKEVHDLAVNINRLEREALEQEQMFQKLKDIEHLIDGIVDLVQCERIYIRHDFVCIAGGLGIKKDRCLFLFSDLLLITNIKRKISAARKTSIAINASPCESLESNKYKLLMRLPLQNIEIIKKVDERSVKRFLKEVNNLESDIAVLGKISDMLGTLSCQHQVLDEAVKEILGLVSKQLIDKQTTNSQLMALDLAVRMQNEFENLTVMFSNPEKRMSWEVSFEGAKENLARISKTTQPPTFLHSIPIRKSRAGLQVTCAVPSEQNVLDSGSDIWICNSDGYVGQICVLSLQNEPTLTSCSHVCNATILCIVHVPGVSQLDCRRQSAVLSHFTRSKLKTNDVEKHFKSFQLDSDTSEEEDFIYTDDDSDDHEYSLGSSEPLSQATMWFGTEDGCIYVYDCCDVRLKKAKLRMHHSAAILDLIYVDSKVYASLANGDIFVYSREQGSWNSSSPQKVEVSSSEAPITKMLFAGGKLWCGSSNNVLLLSLHTLEVMHTFQVVADSDRAVLLMVASGLGVWIAVQNSPIIRLFNFISYHELINVNVAPAVTKMLSACDDIIRQHKSACLRVTALHICKNLLWIGTSAGVLLTMPLPQSSELSSTELLTTITGVMHGHTGHVRMVTSSTAQNVFSSDESVRSKRAVSGDCVPLCVVCAGDGYEDFAGVASSQSAGQEDSTNHLLIWKV